MGVHIKAHSMHKHTSKESNIYLEIDKTVSEFLKWQNVKHLSLSEKRIVVAPNFTQFVGKLCTKREREREEMKSTHSRQT